MRANLEQGGYTTDMSNRHAAHVQRMVDAVLNGPGDTDSALRHDIEAQSAKLGGRLGSEVGEIPAELTAYVSKVALHAYKTLDEDIEALRNAGYSEDAIFEITLSAAIGAGQARLERGLAALKGASDAAQEA
jgi:alkylhydroperoxidase family enzyme